MADKTMNIYQRMAAATADMDTVSKNLNVQTGKAGSYKAVSERDVLDAVKKVEAKYGIYSFPYDRRIVESDQLESETQYGKKTTFYLRIETTYRFVNIDKPEEYIDVKAYGDGMDAGDKSTGKSLTYCDKYCLLKAYKISTGEDPDQEASCDDNYKRRTRTDFTKPAADKDYLLKEVEKLCLTAGIPEEWLAAKFGVKALKDMTEAKLQYALDRPTTISEAYEKENSK